MNKIKALLRSSTFEDNLIALELLKDYKTEDILKLAEEKSGKIRPLYRKGTGVNNTLYHIRKDIIVYIGPEAIVFINATDILPNWNHIYL